MSAQVLSELPPVKREKTKTTGSYQFGTFKGVFTPSMLTILGVVMYLRFGWVLGQQGLRGTLLIVTISCAITFLTGLSLSALATNMKIGGGGAYFIISRSLGLETGAAIGLPLYFAQALGVSFYIAGFSESLLNSYLAPYHELLSIAGLNPLAVVGIGTLIIITAIAYLSADLALKAQLVIFALIFLSLVSFFAGTAQTAPDASLAIDPIAKKSFMAVFAVFFPAVTGIEAGIAMSGDLKNPSKSLPLGTLGSVISSYFIYMAIPLVLAYKVSDAKTLIEDPLIMAKVAYFGPIVLWALWGASLSSAMGALLGAPRTLQALAKDSIIPRIIGRGFGRGGDPRIATIITFAVALTGIIAGGLNVIAPVLSMFFLTSYCLLNVSAAFEGMIASPSWRPTFKVHWSISLFGAIACLTVMIQINFAATILAILVTSAIYYMVKRRSLNASWGDVRYGILMLAARNIIYRIANRKADERTWRPNILVLSGAPSSRWYLIELAHAMSHTRGFLSIGVILNHKVSLERTASLRNSISEFMSKKGIPALSVIHRDDHHLRGAKNLINTYGFGPLVPNTIILGETEKPERFKEYADLIKNVYESKKNLLIVKEGESPPVQLTNGAEINIWWSQFRNNGSLMLALAFLLKASPAWAKAELVLKTIVSNEAEREEASHRLQEFILHSRLEASADVIVIEKNENPFETIRNSSAKAAIIFLGIRPPEKDESSDDYAQYYSQLLEKTGGLPVTVRVLAAEDIEFERIFRSILP